MVCSQWPAYAYISVLDNAKWYRYTISFFIKLLEEEKGFAHIQSKITEANTKLECSKDNRDQLRSKVNNILTRGLDSVVNIVHLHQTLSRF